MPFTHHKLNSWSAQANECHHCLCSYHCLCYLPSIELSETPRAHQFPSMNVDRHSSQTLPNHPYHPHFCTYSCFVSSFVQSMQCKQQTTIPFQDQYPLSIHQSNHPNSSFPHVYAIPNHLFQFLHSSHFSLHYRKQIVLHPHIPC